MDRCLVEGRAGPWTGGCVVIVCMTDNRLLSTSPATLLPNGSKARYGVSYLESICSAVGVPISEPRPDTDVRAIDCTVAFAEGDVHVQVKCSSKTTSPRSKSIGWDLDPGWVEKWSHLRTPVYLLIVRVLRTPSWIDHHDESTLHHAYAVWERVNMRDLGTSVAVPLVNRFSAETLTTWRQDFLECFTAQGSVVVR